MKREKSPILVVICMLFLLIFIIVPPVFRKYIPKQIDTNSTEKVKNTIKILKCNKTFSNEFYQVNSSTKYVDDKIVSNTIRYQKIDSTQNNNSENNQNSNSNEDNVTLDDAASVVTVNDEYNYFSSLSDINITSNDSLTTVVINKKSLESNDSETTLKNYYQDSISSQKKFYENMGYTCNILES